MYTGHGGCRWRVGKDQQMLRKKDPDSQCSELRGYRKIHIRNNCVVVEKLSLCTEYSRNMGKGRAHYFPGWPTERGALTQFLAGQLLPSSMIFCPESSSKTNKAASFSHDHSWVQGPCPLTHPKCPCGIGAITKAAQLVRVQGHRHQPLWFLWALLFRGCPGQAVDAWILRMVLGRGRNCHKGWPSACLSSYL